MWVRANGSSLVSRVPIGAVSTTEKVAAAINFGDHESTVTGGPLVCHAALTVLDKIKDPSFLASVSNKGIYLKQLLTQKLGDNPHVKEVGGLGLIVGIDLDVPTSPLVDACRDSGLLVLTAGNEQAAEVLKECLPVLDGNSSS